MGKLKKDLYIFAPIEEFHTYMKFNAFLPHIKNTYNKIVVVVPEKAIGVITEADELICISNEYMDQRNANYPEILELLEERNISDFHPLATEYIKKNRDNYEILKYHAYRITDEWENEKFPWFTINNSPLTNSYKRDLSYIKEYLQKGNLLKPSQKSFENIKEKYGHMFNENTFIVLTRNFTKKQPGTNSSSVQPNSEKFFQFLIDRGLSIINIGYPYESFKIESPKGGVNYFELFPRFNQEDLFSMFYLSRGLFSYSGGLMLNCCCNCNFFLLTGQWPLDENNLSLINFRPKDKDISTFDFTELLRSGDFEGIYNKINTIKENGDQSFCKEQKITFIDK